MRYHAGVAQVPAESLRLFDCKSIFDKHIGGPGYYSSGVRQFASLSDARSSKMDICSARTEFGPKVGDFFQDIDRVGSADNCREVPGHAFEMVVAGPEIELSGPELRVRVLFFSG